MFNPILALLSLSTPLLSYASPAHNSPSTSKVSMAWYAGWNANNGFPLSKVSWSKYTHMTYAFASTTFDGPLDISNSEPAVLPQFVRQARTNASHPGVKALVSLGGWTGSRGFSVNVGSAENRTTFVKTVTDFALKYRLDGLDFDWEYPNSGGIGCNSINANDTDNFLSFLQELRQHPVGKRLLLTAAVATVPFIGAEGNSLADVSGFASVLDFIAIMNYDLWGPWSATVGPNAPIDDSCAAPENQVGSATSGIRRWAQAGIPASQLVLAVPAYGHSFRVRKANAFVEGSTTELAPHPVFDNSDRPTGDSWDDGPGVDVCGNAQLPGGNINFWGMVEHGFLNADGTPTEAAPFRYDECSQTAYSYNAATEIMVSFDDAQSFAAKGNFIKANELRGFAIWQAGGDYNDILLDAIKSTMGN